MSENHTDHEKTGIRPAYITGIAAAVTTPALLVGAIWAASGLPGRIDAVILLAGLALTTTALCACVVMDARNQRRQRELLGGQRELLDAIHAISVSDPGPGATLHDLNERIAAGPPNPRDGHERRPGG